MSEVKNKETGKISRRAMLKLGVVATTGTALLGPLAALSRFSGQKSAENKGEKSTFVLDQLDMLWEGSETSPDVYFKKTKALVEAIAEGKEKIPTNLEKFKVFITYGLPGSVGVEPPLAISVDKDNKIKAYRGLVEEGSPVVDAIGVLNEMSEKGIYKNITQVNFGFLYPDEKVTKDFKDSMKGLPLGFGFSGDYLFKRDKRMDFFFNQGFDKTIVDTVYIFRQNQGEKSNPYNGEYSLQRYLRYYFNNNSRRLMVSDDRKTYVENGGLNRIDISGMGIYEKFVSSLSGKDFPERIY